MTGTSPRLPSASTSRPGGARVRADGLEREPAGGAEALEAGELRLDGDAGRAGGVDQREAVGEHGGGGLERGRRGAGARSRAGGVGRVDERERERARAARRAPRRRSGQRRRGIGVDPEDDLGLARGDGGGEPVAERRDAAGAGDVARRRPAQLRAPGCYLTAFLRPEPAVKRGTLLAAIVIVSPVRGLRPSRAPRSATWNLPKPVKLTSSPDLSAVSIVLMTASTALPASFLRQTAR